MKRFKKLVASIGASLLLIGGVVLGSAMPASAVTSVSGYVSCTTGNVEGVWVNAVSGTDGWASINPAGNVSSSVSYSYGLTSGTQYYLHVGCGGTTTNWAMSLDSAELTGSGYSLTCDTVTETQYYGRCVEPSKGAY